MSLEVLLPRLINKLTKMISRREERITWLEQFIDDMRRNNINLNRAKGVTAVFKTVIVIKSAGDNAPTWLLELLCDTACLMTKSYDMIANKRQEDNLKDKLDDMKGEDEQFEKLQEMFNKQVELYFKGSKDEAILFQLVSVPKIIDDPGDKSNGSFTSTLKSAVTLVTLITGGRTLLEGLTTAGKAIKDVHEEVARVDPQIWSLVASAFSLADWITGYINENPNVKVAEKLVRKPRRNMEALEDMRELLLEL